MSYRLKVISISLGLLGLVALILFIADNKDAGQYAGLGYAIGMAFMSLAEAGILVLIGIVVLVSRLSAGGRSLPHPTIGQVLDDGNEVQPRRQATEEELRADRRYRGLSYIVAAALVLVVGCSLCFGGLAIYDMS